MRFAFRLFSVWFLCCSACGVFNISAQAQVRASAPRPLGENGDFIEGTHVRFENGELNFVRIAEKNSGARSQLWRAVPADSNAKNQEWSTQAQHEQSPYLLDILASQRALSPDGKTVAFVSQHSGQSAIYIVPASDFGRPERASRIAIQAQSPTWLDGSTLLFESTNPQRSGLFRIAIHSNETPRPEPQLLFSRGGESTVSPDGQTICVAAKSDNSQNDTENGGVTQLYLLAIEGSGARAIPETKGARRPCFAPDGTAIFYDAPAPKTSGTGSTPRVLWTVPLTTAPPTAQLFFVRPDKNGDAEIIGTVFSSEVGKLQTQIEFWPGEETEFVTRPQFVLPVKNAPIHNAALVAWPLPQSGPTHEWTLRLSATDAAGQTAQSTLTFLWPPAETLQPIPAAPTIETPTIEAQNPQTPIATVPVIEKPIAPPQVMPIPPNPIPAVAAAVAPVLPSPASKNTRKPSAENSPKISTAPADLPTPALPPAPRALPQTLTPVPPPTQPAPRAGSTPNTPFPDDPPPVRRSLPPAQPAKKPPEKAEEPAAKPTPPPQTPEKAPEKAGVIPAQMQASSSTSVEVTLRNTGTRSWSSTADSPVRLLVRWVRADSGIRYRWAIKWLRETVEPGQSTKVRFDLDAPSAPGRYILTYALVRLSPEIYDGKSYSPPSPKAADQRWPGEFGAVSFEIEVTS